MVRIFVILNRKGRPKRGRQNTSSLREDEYTSVSSQVVLPERRSDIVVVVVLTLNRSSYPATSAVPPVSFLILHLREILRVQILWSQTAREKDQTLKESRWANQVLAYRVRERKKKNDTREIRTTK